ncbi:MAG: hypothetical protein IAE91_11170 [Ignavibacteriaceae bacterium]|nr:hypothetical protein [Ignavibacteriaceae bacterium]
MAAKRSKIYPALIIMVIFTGLFIYLGIYDSKKIAAQGLTEINFVGNNLLDQSEYINFVYSSKDSGTIFTAAEFRESLLKHQYVVDVSIKQSPDGSAKVSVKEKEPEALLKLKDSFYLITQSKELIPVLNGLKSMNYPVVDNFRIDSIDHNDISKNQDIYSAYKIINAAKILNRKLLNDISGIDLRLGGDIVISITGFKPFVIFGREDTARKIVYLNKLYSERDRLTQSLAKANYIDIRYKKSIFLGIEEEMK